VSGLLQQFAAGLRLHFRNRMALIYSYIFPTIFLVAFWVLYRHERVPLALHLGELLTVTILGGACFGLPTTLVSERERGVWRRYRLAPVPTASIVASTVAARYVLLLAAGLLQIALAMAIGMPLPSHPVQLWVAFTLVAFAFLGLGMVIATMADTVPAVQALGQSIFLPMLILGGVAVPLTSLPDWAQRLALFFPGRYAVDAIQAATTGAGLREVTFSLAALVVIGAAAFAAGARLFRWDAMQRFAAIEGKGWVAAAVVAWVAVGVAAVSMDRRPPARQASVALITRAPAPASGTATGAEASAPALSPAEQAAAAPPPADAPSTPVAPPAASAPSSSAPASAAPTPSPASSAPPSPAAGTSEPVNRPAREAHPALPPARSTTAEPEPSQPAPVPALPARTAAAEPQIGSTANGDTGAAGGSSGSAAIPLRAGLTSWRDVTPADVERDLVFDRLPPDSGIVAPIAPIDEDPGPELGTTLDVVRSRLPTWGPARVADPVQRVRNILYVAAVPDVFQIPLERYLPHVVYERLQADFPKEQLIQLLYWIALHPNDGDESALDQLQDLGLENGPPDTSQVRERVAYYGVKLLGRLVGKIPPS
jgi:hypothetical protein